MENVVRKITIYSKQVHKDKQTFIASFALINGTWFKIKFVKGCDKPEEKGVYDIAFNTDDCYVERGKSYKTKDGGVRYDNDTIWIKKVESIYSDEIMKKIKDIKDRIIEGEATEIDRRELEVLEGSLNIVLDIMSICQQ